MIYTAISSCSLELKVKIFTHFSWGSMVDDGTVEIVYNEHQDQAEFARYNRFSL